MEFDCIKKSKKSKNEIAHLLSKKQLRTVVTRLQVYKENIKYVVFG